MPANLDDQVRATLQVNPNMLVPHYLVHSYLYYELDTAVISDGLYEDLCKWLRREWPRVAHRHKDLVDFGSLSAGTGYYLKDYPGMVKGAATQMVDDFNKLQRKGKRRSPKR